jgi:glycosyltransferase involved in cell wall biosynthesis
MTTDPLRVAWVYPLRKRCGISFYANAYVDALKQHCAVTSIDPGDILSKRAATLRALRDCQIVHVQYETSLYLDRGRDLFDRLRSAVRSPLVVSLHEVYERTPWSYPREMIRGTGMAKRVREWVYDLRHPYERNLDRHILVGFGASRILVHHAYHRDILVAKGIGTGRIEVIPHPVKSRPAASTDVWADRTRLRLAATGFVNPAYDYDLLFAALERLSEPWRFCWIGGLRREEDRPVLDRINSEVDRRGWAQRFSVTGWVEDGVRDQMLGGSHIVCALFKMRSSSESLATSIGARCCIVATDLPLVREIAQSGTLVCVPADADSVASTIRGIWTDEKRRVALRECCARYAAEVSYEVMALRLVGVYNRLLEGRFA